MCPGFTLASGTFGLIFPTAAAAIHIPDGDGVEMMSNGVETMRNVHQLPMGGFGMWVGG